MSEQAVPQTTAADPFISPCAPPEGLQRELLEVIAEECAEVIQRVTKALRFGLDEVQPGQPWTNNYRIGLEVGDIYETIRQAQEIGLVPHGAVASGMEAKEGQLRRFLQKRSFVSQEPSNAD